MNTLIKAACGGIIGAALYAGGITYEMPVFWIIIGCLVIMSGT